MSASEQRPVTGKFGKFKARQSDRWRALKERRPGVAHLVTAYQHYKANHGDHLAAAITYFSFLALFPLIFLAVSITGFILSSHPGLINDMKSSIDHNVPGSFGDTLKGVVDYAVTNRAKVGVIGLLGVAWTGLGWIANLRTAIDTVWGNEVSKRPFAIAKGFDALVLVGLGAGIALSLGLTAFGTAATGQILDWLNLSRTLLATVLTRVLGIGIAVLGDMLVFGWLLLRLPQVKVPRRTAIRSTLMAAIGFEVLKLVGTFYLARIAQSPAAAVLGAVVGVLIFIDLVSRYLLFCVAWAATAGLPSQAALIADEIPAEAVPTAPPPRPTAPMVSPIGLAAGLISAGAALGAAALAGLQSHRRRGRLPRR
ncbi:MAG TPA: YhjD/YihY/BrkB family envelope integrity protein [Jatrophihabitans sp.]|jgi:membrane protein